MGWYVLIGYWIGLLVGYLFFGDIFDDKGGNNE